MQGFILTRHWRDTSQGIQLEFWLASDQGPVQLFIDAQEAVFFIRRNDKSLIQNRRGYRVADVELCNFRNEPVAAVYCQSYRQARELSRELQAKQVGVWEADIRPAERYLMERFITGGINIHGGNLQQPTQKIQVVHNPHLSPSAYQPTLKRVSLDIETSMDAQELYSIAVLSETESRVYMVGAPPRQQLEAAPQSPAIEWCPTPRQCLQGFLLWLEASDPDVLIGWNLIQFDLWVLENLCRRHRVEFRLGRGGRQPHWREESDGERRYIGIPGRIALDGIELIKTATYRFESFSLETVSQTLLGEGKLLHGQDRGGDITDLFHQNKHQLAVYNLRDCQLVWRIFAQEKLLAFALERARLTGLAIDRVGGSVAAFEYAYLPRLHRKGFVAPNLGEQESDIASPGGYVLDSRPGLYTHILVLDFKSLYPSIIRSFAIDPIAFRYALHRQVEQADCVPGFNGARFARAHAVLPGIIESLWSAREKAKAQHNAPLSYAIKIIMNSYYGVLGSPGCRFFDPRISSSITLRGHEIIQRSRDWIERQGYQVIYGDTDSVFVWVNRENCTDFEAASIGKTLELGLNSWWRDTLREEFGVESALEVEFETHYQKFFMPTIRGSELGSKKRYAGLVGGKNGPELVFKGLETVRTDWTPLAKQFQEELYRRIFLQQPFEQYIRELVADVLGGGRDSELVYRKRLRRRLAEYRKNIPPHVQAARKLERVRGITLKRGEWVNYVLTVNGPEPVEFLREGIGSSLSYQSYIDRQLAPIADSILYFTDTSFAQIIDRQLQLI